MQKSEIEVLKIGGGILRNKESFDKVIEIVKEKRNKKKKLVLVLSALYGVTDFLIETGTKSLHNEEEIDNLIKKIKEMHLEYINYLKDEKVKEKAIFKLGEKISILEKFLFGVSYLKELSPRSKDLIQSFGERLSPIVLEAFLLDNKVNAKFIDAKEAGIVAVGNFEKAHADLDNTKNNFSKLVLPELKNNVVLLPGYYGVDNNNDVKTFGRGGTDYSAGFITNILNAKLEIWKDVSGFMSADPKIVPSAKQINHLSYEEAEELGYLGAKILHPKTIDPLREKNLSCEIKNLFNPSVKGTIISKHKSSEKTIIKSIAATKNISTITIQSSAMVNNSGFAAKIFSKLAEKEVEIDLISTGETAISFTLNPKDITVAKEKLLELKDELSCNISEKNDLSLIGVIGEGMKETKGIAGKIFNVIGEEKINIELISQGASEINISFVVEEKDLEKAISVIHKKFIG